VGHRGGGVVSALCACRQSHWLCADGTCQIRQQWQERHLALDGDRRPVESLERPVEVGDGRPELRQVVGVDVVAISLPGQRVQLRVGQRCDTRVDLRRVDAHRLELRSHLLARKSRIDGREVRRA